MRLLLCLFLAFAVAQAAYDVGRKCKQGEKGEKEGIRYFVDAERQTVYPFLFPGCGGTANNRFKTRRDALDTLQVDGIQCPGWSKSQGECGNRPLRQGETGDGCPKGTVCQMGHAFGLCCNEQATVLSMWFLLPLACFFATALAYDTLTLSRAPVYDVGHKCQPNEKGEIAGIRYFVDQERYVIYPFFYLGCGGEEFNRYKSRRDAVAGLPMDFSACTGWSTSEAMCGGPRLPGDTAEECPKGTVCEMGAFFGQCCSKEVAARYNENRKAACPKKSRGAQKYTDEDQKTESIEFGRSCTHNFCQNGAICIEGEFEAYCCLN